MNMQFDRLETCSGHIELGDPTLRGDTTLSRNRMWSLRFRMRWNLTLGKAPTREAVDTAVLTENVFSSLVVAFQAK